MNWQQLKTEIEKAEYIGKTDAEIAAILNAKTVEGLVPTWIQARTLASKFGPSVAGQVIYGLQQAVAGMTGADRATYTLILDWLTNPASEGVDVGDASTRASIDAMVGAGLVPAELGEAVKSMAIIRVPFAETIGIAGITIDADIVATARAKQ